MIVLENETKTNNSMSEVGYEVLRAFLRTDDFFAFENGKKNDKKKKDKKKKDKKKKKKDKKKKEKKEKEEKETYNIFKADHDVENPNGWSVTTNNEQLNHVMQNSEFSVFMVNLTEVSSCSKLVL